MKITLTEIKALSNPPANVKSNNWDAWFVSAWRTVQKIYGVDVKEAEK